MPFEHFLEPVSGRFPPAALEAIHARVRALPHRVWPDGAYTLYPTPGRRDAAAAVGEPEGASAILHAAPERVLVATVGDPVTDRALRDLVEAVQARWPARLYYGDREVAPADLTAGPYAPGERPDRR